MASRRAVEGGPPLLDLDEMSPEAQGLARRSVRLPRTLALADSIAERFGVNLAGNARELWLIEICDWIEETSGLTECVENLVSNAKRVRPSGEPWATFPLSGGGRADLFVDGEVSPEDGRRIADYLVGLTGA